MLARILLAVQEWIALSRHDCVFHESVRVSESLLCTDYREPQCGMILSSSFLGELVDTRLSVQQDHVRMRRMRDSQRSSAHGDHYCLRNLHGQTIQEGKGNASQVICCVNKQESELEENRNETYTWGHIHIALFRQALH